MNEEYHRKNQDSDTLCDDRFRNTGPRTLQAFAARYIHLPIGTVVLHLHKAVMCRSNRVSTSNRLCLIVLTQKCQYKYFGNVTKSALKRALKSALKSRVLFCVTLWCVTLIHACMITSAKAIGLQQVLWVLSRMPSRVLFFVTLWCHSHALPQKSHIARTWPLVPPNSWTSSVPRKCTASQRILGGSCNFFLGILCSSNVHYLVHLCKRHTLPANSWTSSKLHGMP